MYAPDSTPHQWTHHLENPTPGPTNAHLPHEGKLRRPLPGHHVHEERGDEHVVERLGDRLPHVEVVVPLNAPRAPPATPVPQRRDRIFGDEGKRTAPTQSRLDENIAGQDASSNQECQNLNMSQMHWLTEGHREREWRSGVVGVGDVFVGEREHRPDGADGLYGHRIGCGAPVGKLKGNKAREENPSECLMLKRKKMDQKYCKNFQI